MLLLSVTLDGTLQKRNLGTAGYPVVFLKTHSAVSSTMVLMAAEGLDSIGEIFMKQLSSILWKHIRIKFGVWICWLTPRYCPSRSISKIKQIL